MKKIFSILIVLILLTACSSSNLKNIKLNDLNKKLDNKETFILYLTNEDESGFLLKNTLNNVLKNSSINGYYLNTSKLSEKDLTKLKSIITYEESNFIVFIKKGTESSTLSRIDDVYISEKDLKEELKLQDYIK